MALSYVFPPRIAGGSIYRAQTESEYVEGKILQTLSILRNELVANPNFGSPLRIFNSTSDIAADSARLETILTQEIIEANFRVTSNLLEDGLVKTTIYWEFLGTEKELNFEINL